MMESSGEEQAFCIDYKVLEFRAVPVSMIILKDVFNGMANSMDDYCRFYLHGDSTCNTGPR